MLWPWRVITSEKQFGDKYLPDNAIRYSSREGAQEAHEAIRPSDVNVLENSSRMDALDRDAVRLYNLIWQQFLACQMTPARYKSSTIKVEASGYSMRIKGRIMEFDGYTRVLPVSKDGDVELPDLKVGDKLLTADSGSGAAFHQAATALHRSKPGKRTGKTQYWPTLYLCRHYFHDSGSWLCEAGKPPFLCAKNGRYRDRSPGGKLQGSDGL